MDYRCIRCEDKGIPLFHMTLREAEMHDFEHKFIKRDIWQDFEQADQEDE